MAPLATEETAVSTAGGGRSRRARDEPGGKEEREESEEEACDRTSVQDVARDNVWGASLEDDKEEDHGDDKEDDEGVEEEGRVVCACNGSLAPVASDRPPRRPRWGVTGPILPTQDDSAGLRNNLVEAAGVKTLEVEEVEKVEEVEEMKEVEVEEVVEDGMEDGRHETKGVKVCVWRGMPVACCISQRERRDGRKG